MRDCIWRQQREQTAMNIPQTQMANILLKDTQGKDNVTSGLFPVKLPVNKSLNP